MLDQCNHFQPRLTQLRRQTLYHLPAPGGEQDVTYAHEPVTDHNTQPLTEDPALFVNQMQPALPRARSWLRRPVILPVWVLLLFSLMAIIGVIDVGISSIFAVQFASSTQPNSQEAGQKIVSTTTLATLPITATPATHVQPSSTWLILYQFSGTGNQKTTLFTVSTLWKLSWSCTADASSAPHYLQVDIKYADGSTMDAGAIDTTCQAASISDSLEEHVGGAMYLDIHSSTGWKFQIQELNQLPG